MPGDAQPGQHSITDAEWTAIPVDDRWGFSRDEFLGLVSKYSEVLAVPIYQHTRVIGMLSLDRTWHKNDDDTKVWFGHDEVRGDLERAADTLGPDTP